MSPAALEFFGFGLPVTIIALGVASGRGRHRASVAVFLAGIFVSVRYQSDRIGLTVVVAGIYLVATRWGVLSRRQSSSHRTAEPTTVYSSAQSRRALLAAGALVVGMGAVDVFTTGFTPYQVAGSLILVGLLALLALELDRGISFTRTLADSVSVFGLMLLVGATKESAFLECNSTFDKCSFLGRLYSAGLTSENSVGLACSILLAVIVSNWTRVDRPLRWAAIPLAIGLLASGSRTGMVAVAVGVVLAFTVGASVVEKIYGRPATRAFVAVCVVVPGTWLVWNSGETDFSRRGLIWSSAIDQLGGLRLVGLGRQAWSLSQDAGLLPQHYPHSQSLLLLYFGGAWALVVYAFLISQVAVPVSGGRWAPLGAAVFGVVGFAEVVWDPTGFDIGFWMLLLLVCSTCVGHAAGGRERLAVVSDTVRTRPRQVNR